MHENVQIVKEKHQSVLRGKSSKHWVDIKKKKKKRRLRDSLKITTKLY